MNPLPEAIALMTKEEQRAFKLYAQKVQVKGKRRDIALFDLIRDAGDAYDDTAAAREIYPRHSINAFHRLKSRLLAEINKSQVLLQVDHNETLKLYHFLSVVEFYFQKRHFELAHWFLRKADKLAKRLNQYEALEIILNGYIRLSQQVVAIDPEPYIERRKQNRATLTKIQELDDVLAAAIHKVAITQNYGPAGSEIMDLLQETVHKYVAEGAISANPPFRFKLFQAISRIMLDRRDYVTLETYTIATLEEFERDGLFSRQWHDNKLQMLTFIVNALHKNARYEASLQYAAKMREEIDAFGGFLRRKYEFFYFNSLVINYFELDISKAIAVLEEMVASPALVEVPFYELFIHMNLALAWHDQGNLQKSIRYVVKTYLLEGFKTAAPALQLRVAVAELIVRYKLRQYDMVVQRVRQVKNDFKASLKTSEFGREKALVALIARMNEVLDPKTDKRCQKYLKQFHAIHTAEDSRDGELMDYEAFIKESGL